MRKVKAKFAVCLAVLMVTQSVPAAPTFPPTLTPFKIKLPASLGVVSESYAPARAAKSATPDVILIEDLHVNRSVQFAISGILKRLKKQGLLRGAVSVEGATGPVDVASMQRYPDAKIRKATADYLVRQGEMPGPMHFVVTEGVGHLYGIETPEYYQANLDMFRQSYKERDALRRELNNIRTVLPQLKKDKALKQNAALLEKDLQSVENLINNAVIPDELLQTLAQASQSVENLKAVLPTEKGLVESLSASINFYALALLRDEELFKNAMHVRQQNNQQTSVIVAGGFHSQALMDLFKRRGLSYAVITPNVKRHNQIDEKLYVKRLLNEHLTEAQAAAGLDWAAMQMLLPTWPTVKSLFASRASSQSELKRQSLPVRLFKNLFLAAGTASMLVVGSSQPGLVQKVVNPTLNAQSRTQLPPELDPNDAVTVALLNYSVRDRISETPETYTIYWDLQHVMERRMFIDVSVYGEKGTPVRLHIYSDVGQKREKVILFNLYRTGENVVRIPEQEVSPSLIERIAVEVPKTSATGRAPIARASYGITRVPNTPVLEYNGKPLPNKVQIQPDAELEGGYQEEAIMEAWRNGPEDLSLNSPGFQRLLVGTSRSQQIPVTLEQSVAIMNHDVWRMTLPSAVADQARTLGLTFVLGDGSRTYALTFGKPFRSESWEYQATLGPIDAGRAENYGPLNIHIQRNADRSVHIQFPLTDLLRRAREQGVPIVAIQVESEITSGIELKAVAPSRSKVGKEYPMPAAPKQGAVSQTPSIVNAFNRVVRFFFPVLDAQSKVDVNAPVAPFRSLADATKFISEQRTLGAGLPATFRIPDNARIVNPSLGRVVREGVGLYDTALAIIALTQAGDFAQARQILDIFAAANLDGKAYGTNMDLKAFPNGNNGGAFTPFRSSTHYFFNFTRLNGRWGQEWDQWQTHTGPNAWLALSWALYLEADPNGPSSARYRTALRNLADAMLLLQAGQQNTAFGDTQGGLRYGPRGVYHEPGTSDPFLEINSENNVSAYPALVAAGRVLGDAKYTQAANRILSYFQNAQVYNPETGETQRGLFNPRTHTLFMGVEYKNNRWELQTRFATDSAGTWTISAIGPEQIDRMWGEGTAYKMLMTVRQRAGRTSTYQPAGANNPIAGVDFTDIYPANQGLISPEWSAGYRDAALLLANFYRGKNIITPQQIAGLERDAQTILEFINGLPNGSHYANGPGMDSPRNGATGHGWFSAPGAATASIYMVLRDPLDAGRGDASLVNVPAASPAPAAPRAALPPAAAPTPIPVPTPAAPAAQPGVSAGQVEVLADITSGVYQGTNGDFAIWVDGDFNLPSGTRLRFVFPTSQAGTRFRWRLLPANGNPNQPTGLSRTPVTIPANGVVEVVVNAAALGIPEEALRSIRQISFHSGTNGFGSLNQPADRHATPDRVERVGSGLAAATSASPGAAPTRAAQPATRAPAPTPAPAAPAAQNEVLAETLGGEFNGRIGDYATWFSGSFNLPSGTRLRFVFPESQAGTRFRWRLLPRGASASSPYGLNPTPVTIPANGIVEVVVRASELQRISEAQLSEIIQISFHSGASGFGSLKQSQDKQATPIRVEKVSQGAAVQGDAGVLARVVETFKAGSIPGLMLMPVSFADGPTGLLSHRPAAAVALIVTTAVLGILLQRQNMRAQLKEVAARVRSGLARLARVAVIPAIAIVNIANVTLHRIAGDEARRRTREKAAAMAKRTSLLVAA